MYAIKYFKSMQFLTDTFRFEADASVVDSSEDDEGSYVVTDHTIYYPGGGGQEPDKGAIFDENGKEYTVLDAFFDTNSFKHYIAEKLPVGEKIKIRIDGDYRVQNAQLHTAGHLLAAVVYEKLKWPLKPIKGFHYQQGAYIEFDLEDEMFTPSDANSLLLAVEEDIAKDLPLTADMSSFDNTDVREVLESDSFFPEHKHEKRTVAIQGYKAVPCGGTHLESTGAIEHFTIKQLLYKKGKIRINYSAGKESQSSQID